MESEKFDFLVIGAPKSGTTTLYEWLRRHPDVLLPELKEIPFFTNKNYNVDMDRKFFDTYIGNLQKGKLVGKVSPHYMCGEEEVEPYKIANNIYKHNKNIKLIAVLRHPVDRAYSDYKMAFRRGYISKSFLEAAREELFSKAYIEHRLKPNDFNRFLVASEYGRILNDYLSFFDRKQFHIIFSDNLLQNPRHEFFRLTEFLGINSRFTPENIDKRYHQGGSRPKFRFLTPGFIYKIPYLKLIWKRTVPDFIRRKIEFSINQWNVKSDDKTLDSDSSVFRELVSFYGSDVHILERNFHISVPWEDYS